MNRKHSRTSSAGPSGSASLSSPHGTTAKHSASSRLASGSRNAVAFGANTSSSTGSRRLSAQPTVEGPTLLMTPSAIQRNLIGQGTTGSCTQQAGLRTQSSRSDSVISGLARTTMSRSATSTLRRVSGAGLVASDFIHITPVSAGIKSLFDDDSSCLLAPRQWHRTESREAAAIMQQLEGSAVASISAHHLAHQVQSRSEVYNQEERGVLLDLARMDVRDDASASCVEESRDRVAFSSEGVSAGLRSSSIAEHKSSNEAVRGGALLATNDGLERRQDNLSFSHIASFGEKRHSGTASSFRTESGSLKAAKAENISSSASTTEHAFGNQAEGRNQDDGLCLTVIDDALHTRRQDTVLSGPEKIPSVIKVGSTGTESKPSTTGTEQNIGTAVHGTGFTQTTGLRTATATDANVTKIFDMPAFPSDDFFRARKTSLPASIAVENNSVFVSCQDGRMKQSEADMTISRIKDQLWSGPTPSHKVTSGDSEPFKVGTATEEKVTNLAQGPMEEKVGISEPVILKSERSTISSSEKACDQVVASEPANCRDEASALWDVSQQKGIAKLEAPTATDTSNYSYSSGAQVTMKQKSTARWKNNTPVQQSHFEKIEGSNYQKTFASSLVGSEQTPGGGTTEFQVFHITSSSGSPQDPTEESTEIVKGRLELTPEHVSTYTSRKKATKAERCASDTAVALTPLPELPPFAATPKVSSEELHSIVAAKSSSKTDQHGSWQSPVVENKKTHLGAAAALFEPCVDTLISDAPSVNTELSHRKESTEEFEPPEKSAGASLAPLLERPSYLEAPLPTATQMDTWPPATSDVGSQPGILKPEKPIGEDVHWPVHVDSSLVQYAADDGVLERIVREVEKKILASAGNNFEPLPDGTFPVRSSKGIESLGRLKYEAYEEGPLLRRSQDNLLGAPTPESPAVSEREQTSRDERTEVGTDEGAYAGVLEEFYAEAQKRDRECQQEQSEQAVVTLSKEAVSRTEGPVTIAGEEAQEQGVKFEIERTWREDSETKDQGADKAREVREQEQEFQDAGCSEQAVANVREDAEVRVEDSTYAGQDEKQKNAAGMGMQREWRAVQQVKEKEIGIARPVRSLDALGRKKWHEANKDEASKESLMYGFALTPEKKKSAESKVYIQKHETDAFPENAVRRFIAAAIEEAAMRKHSQNVKKFREYSCEKIGSVSSESLLSKKTHVTEFKSQQEKDRVIPQHLASKSMTELIEEMINQNVRGNDARTCLDLAREKVGFAQGAPRPLPEEHRAGLRQPREVTVYYQTASMTPRFGGKGTEDFRGSPLVGVRKSETHAEQSQLDSTSQMENPLSFSSTSGRGTRCTIRKIEPGVLTYLVEVSPPPDKSKETQSDMVMAEEQLLVSEIFEHLRARSPRTSSSALALNEARAASAAKSSESLSGLRNAYAEAVARRVLGRVSPTVTEGVPDQEQRAKFLEKANHARKAASSLSFHSSASVEDYIVHSMLTSELSRNRAEKLSMKALKREHAFPRRSESAGALFKAKEANYPVPPPSPADHDKMVDVSKPEPAPRGAAWKLVGGKAPTTVTVAGAGAATKETVTNDRPSSSRSEAVRTTGMAEPQLEHGRVEATPQGQLVKDASSRTCGLCDNQIRAEESLEAFICLGMHDLSPNLVPIPSQVSDVIKLRIATDSDVREVVSLLLREQQSANALAAEVATRHVVCPSGFYVAVDTAQGRICGAASIIIFDEEVASCGFCFVHKDYSFQDVGALLWNQVLHATSGKNLFTLLPLPESEQLLSLYHLPSSTATGILSGPILVSRAALERKVLVLDYKEKYFEALASYDKHVFGFSRRRFLAASMLEVGLYVCVATRNERNVCGYGGIQRDEAGRLVLRWLFADDSETAESLLSCLLASWSHEDEISVVVTFFLRSMATRPILDKVNARRLKPWSMVYTKREPVHSYGRIVCLTSV